MLSVRVVVAQLCARVPGGTARYAGALVRALAEELPQDAKLDAVTDRGCAAIADLSVPVRQLHLPGVLTPRLWERGLPPHVARAGVVHAPTLLVPPRRRSTPLVVTIHDVVPWTHPQTLTPRGVAFHRRMGARAAREAAVIVTPTAAVATAVRDILAPACPVVPIHSGVAVPTVLDGEERRPSLGVTRPYVLFVGTAEPRKGLDRLVAAMAESPLADLDLVVVGPEGWGDVRVADLAAALGPAVAARVKVTGHVSETELWALYAGAQVLAMPSQAEGFGFPVLEAMALGVPVVTSTDPALVEVGGGVATAVDPVDVAAFAAAIAALAAPGSDRDEVSAAGLARAATFTWSATAAATWATYRSVAPD